MQRVKRKQDEGGTRQRNRFQKRYQNNNSSLPKCCNIFLLFPTGSDMKILIQSILVCLAVIIHSSIPGKKAMMCSYSFTAVCTVSCSSCEYTQYYLRKDNAGKIPFQSYKNQNINGITCNLRQGSFRKNVVKISVNGQLQHRAFLINNVFKPCVAVLYHFQCCRNYKNMNYKWKLASK